ncbi:MFS transporter [Actinomadura logoneensis]|uniref:MFS transporter n=1 Tax=Actinomadura logoneensis TaxID=2293572 RepID=A0A372JEK5_9ACTN|nr:MFS transporter [Actinomadura logoneensis]RFU38390.1 MFS transporter [Actinomadura logoneensis]
MTTTLDAVRRPVLAERDFRLLFTAAAASKISTQLGALAVPLLAQSVLHAGPGQVGLLAALGTAAFLLVGLPAGAWVDRMRKRRVLVAADLVRAGLVGSVPAAWALGVLTLPQLYAVTLLSGVATVFFDVAHLSVLPALVGRGRLVAANAALAGLSTVSDVSGRAVGGFVVQGLGAPLAVLVDAFGYLWSACFLRNLRPAESGRPYPASGRRGVGEGLRFVLGHPVLRPTMLEGALANFSIQMCQVGFLVLFTSGLRLPAGVLGLFLAAGGAGAFLGSLAAPVLARRLGVGRALWLAGIAVAPFAPLVALVQRGPLLWAAGLCWAVSLFKVGVDNVLLVSFRQHVTPDAMLGRMNATARFLLTGALALGGVLAGIVGQYAGVRAVLWIGVTGLAFRWLIVFFSPVRRVTTMDEEAAGLASAPPQERSEFARPGSERGA